MKKITQEASRIFEYTFKHSAKYFFQAPGRVNLIGEHTDYNQGFVLPCAINRATVLAISLRNDSLIRVVAANLGQEESQWISGFPVEKVIHQAWSNYFRGVYEQFFANGYSVRGMNIVALGDIPQGAGLSSSASLAVAFATAIQHLNSIKLSKLEIALLCQAAENHFVGCQCGIMDQLISAAGTANHALLIDCNNLSHQTVALPSNAKIVIVDSKISRGLVTSEYNTRRKQCELSAKAMGLTSLRHATLDKLQRAKNVMDEKSFKRARHVITENDRTRRCASALLAGDYQMISVLMAQSHRSMRDDFQITVPQIDFLVEKINEIIGDQGGVRMTGGGFGGCVIALVPAQIAEKITANIGRLYMEKTQLRAEIHVCQASDGAEIIT